MTKEKKPTPIESALTEYNTENLTMSAIKIFKDAEALECVDIESRKVIGKHRAQIKTFRIQVEDKRKEINRDSQKDNNNKATMLVDILNLSFDVFDKKIKAYDSVAEEKRLAKVKIERDRLGLIQWRMDGLIEDCASLKYGMNSQQIDGEIRFLEMIEVSAVDFDIRFEEANEKLEEAKHFALDAHERALDWEAKQKAEAELAAKNKADAEALAEKTKAFEAQQEKAKADQKEKDDAAALVVSKEAEKTRKANAKLEADRKALDKEKADLAAEKQADEDQKKAEAEEAQTILDIKNAVSGAWDLAHEDNSVFDAGWARAKSVDEDIKKAKLKADKDRAKLITSDKKKIQKTVNQIDKMISEIKPLEYGTDEGGQVVLDLYIKLKEALSDAEIAGTDLA